MQSKIDRETDRWTEEQRDGFAGGSKHRQKGRQMNGHLVRRTKSEETNKERLN